MTNSPEISLHFDRYTVGAIRFPHAQTLQARRAMDGIALTIPAEIELNNHKNVSGSPLVSAVRATVAAFGEEVGVADDLHLHVAANRDELALVLRVPSGVLRALESKRNGGTIVLSLHVEGRLSVLRDVALFRRTWDDPGWIVEQMFENDQPVVRPVQGEPVRVTGAATVTLDPLAWANMLKATGFGDNVFVEIPLPPSPDPKWDDVWKALQTARDALNRGGDTAWQTVVVQCRHALEEWQKAEPEQHGAGWTSPSTVDRKKRTKEERRDNLRWHLLQCAHEAAHSHADQWTRDDAVLVLATLAGLLAVRKP